MIVTTTFVGQVMKFEDLKELGSKSAVKVYTPSPRTFLLSACFEFRLDVSNVRTVGIIYLDEVLVLFSAA